jgi:hypothetical protein
LVVPGAGRLRRGWIQRAGLSGGQIREADAVLSGP